MSEKQYSDDDLEEELEEAFRKSEKKPNVFKIIRNETNALDQKGKRMMICPESPINSGCWNLLAGM